MKYFAVAMIFAMIVVPGCYGEESMTSDDGNKIGFRFADKEIIVLLVDNSATRSLSKILPLTLEFQDYAESEKISYLPEKLDASNVPAGYDPSVGDLTLYAPWGNLAFFYRDHGYARGLVPLGTIVSGLAFLGEMDSVAAVHVETAK